MFLWAGAGISACKTNCSWCILEQEQWRLLLRFRIWFVCCYVCGFDYTLMVNLILGCYRMNNKIWGYDPLGWGGHSPHIPYLKNAVSSVFFFLEYDWSLCQRCFFFFFPTDGVAAAWPHCRDGLTLSLPWVPRPCTVRKWQQKFRSLFLWISTVGEGTWGHKPPSPPPHPSHHHHHAHTHTNTNIFTFPKVNHNKVTVHWVPDHPTDEGSLRLSDWQYIPLTPSSCCGCCRPCPCSPIKQNLVCRSQPSDGSPLVIIHP